MNVEMKGREKKKTRTVTECHKNVGGRGCHPKKRMLERNSFKKKNVDGYVVVRGDVPYEGRGK